MSHILVVFQSNTESVEQLALAVAVGAVEAEALIRLRRLAAPDAPEVGHKSYGKLTAADLVWADAIVVGLEDASPNPIELDPLVDGLRELTRSQDGSPAAKTAVTFGPEGPDAPRTDAQRFVEEACMAAGIKTVPPAEAISDDLLGRMKQVGRWLAQEK
jgi:hypothetical protein